MTAHERDSDAAVDRSAEGPGERPEVSILIPCLNEDQNIAVLIDKLVRLLGESGMDAEILIIDDCSDDYTFREAFLLSARYPNVVALHKGLPRGIGHAIRHGLEHARGDVGVVLMGDNVDPLAAIPDMRRLVIENDADLVLVNRYRAPGGGRNVPLWPYRVLQIIFWRLCQLAIGLPHRDPTYAFRGFKVDFARSLNLESGGFEISPEITLKSWLRGARIEELSGGMGRRVSGESKFIFSRQALGFGRVLLKAAIAYRAGTWERGPTRAGPGTLASESRHGGRPHRPPAARKR